MIFLLLFANKQNQQLDSVSILSTFCLPKQFTEIIEKRSVKVYPAMTSSTITSIKSTKPYKRMRVQRGHVSKNFLIFF